jgi:hypothetical protein
MSISKKRKLIKHEFDTALANIKTEIAIVKYNSVPSIKKQRKVKVR